MAITAWITVQNCSTVTLPGRYGNSRNQPDTDIRSVQDNRAGETFAIGGEQGNRPSGLAVSIEDRRCPGMAARHYEIDRIPFMQGNADFRIALEVGRRHC